MEYSCFSLSFQVLIVYVKNYLFWDIFNISIMFTMIWCEFILVPNLSAFDWSLMPLQFWQQPVIIVVELRCNYCDLARKPVTIHYLNKSMSVMFYITGFFPLFVLVGLYSIFIYLIISPFSFSSLEIISKIVLTFVCLYIYFSIFKFFLQEFFIIILKRHMTMVKDISFYQ